MKRFNDFKKSKFNLRLSFIALTLLFISLITMTYCWIEGSTQIKILNEGTDILVKSTSNQSKVKLDENYTTNSIDLSNYIDNVNNLYFAPAQMTNSKIQIKDGNSFRAATTNDIGNNYIEFDVKIKVNKEHKFRFSDTSEITVGGNKVNPIRVALKLDNTPITRVYSSELKYTEDSNDETNRDAFLISDNNEHNLKVIIWYDDAIATSTSFNGEGQTVNFNFELVAINNCVALEFVDRTTSETTNHLTNGRTMKVFVAGNVYSMTRQNNHSYKTEEEIPITPLTKAGAEFRCYDGSALVSKWSAPATNINRKTYTAYGDLIDSGGQGTWDDVVQVKFIDNTVDKSFNKSGNHVTLYNGIDGTKSYNMYHNTASDFWTGYAPTETFTLNKTLCFNSRNSSSTSISFCEAAANFAVAPANPTYSVYGDSGDTGEYSDKSYVGKWCDNFDSITVRSYDNTISALSGDFWVSFDSWKTKYKAVKSSSGHWSFNVPNDEKNPLDFQIGTYEFNGENRTKTENDYIYTIESTTKGSWEGSAPTRNVTVKDAPHANVTVTYRNSNGGNESIAEGQSAQVPQDTVLTLNAQTATGISASALNGHKFTRFTVNTTNYNQNNAQVTVGNADLTISTTTTPYDFYIGGSGLSEFAGWEDGKLMTYNSSTNSVSYKVTNTASSGNLIKISEIGFSSTYRDNQTYSVTLNSPKISRSGSVTSVMLSSATGELKDTALEFSATANSTITVTYKLDTNTITLAGTAPQTNTVYLRNSANWSTPKVHYWKNNGANGTNWPGVNMTKVSGDIWKYEIPTEYNRVQFNQGTSDNQSSDLTIYNNYIYDNNTKTWSSYDPNAKVMSDYYLRGTLTDWDPGKQMSYQSGSSTIVETTVTLTANTTYKMKIYHNGTWYTNSTTVTGSCSGLSFNDTSAGAGDFNFKPTSSGTYNFSFNTSSKTITIQKQ